MAALIDGNSKGVYIISITPFAAEGKIDWKSTDRLIDFYLERGVSGVPVVGPKGDLIGVVSQTDLVRQDHAGATVACVMTPWTVSFEEDTEVKELARQMLAKKIHRVVITREGRLCGIVTSMDMVRAMLTLLDGN